jgi:hypothetical protein
MGEPLSSNVSFPLHLIMYFDHAFVGIAIGMSSELGLTSKNLLSTGFDKKSTDCSTSIG